MEVKPGRAAPYVPPPEGQALHLVRATLDPSAADGARCVLRVQMDGGTALLVASLRAGVHESVALDLLLEEYAEFTITGDASVHLIGNLVAHHPSSASDESDDDDDDEAYVPSSEEMELMVDGGWMDASDSDEDEEEFEVESDEDDAWAQVAAHQRTNVVIEELEDVDPVPCSLAGTNRSPSNALATEEAKENTKTKKKKKRNQAQANEPEPLPQGSQPAKRSKESERNEKDAPDTKDRNGTQAVGSNKQASTKKEQKKGKKPTKEDAEEDAPRAGLVQGNKHVRRYENGFEIVELHMGQPDGKLAQPGKKVEMRYVGKLKSNGRVFDQTKGKSTFKFRLGVGEVIKGWDVGVQGMRVGDKRRLTIPPQMAYGSGGVKGAIPPNATLTFDVELVHVW
uniref:peptidylprolyl isomerase n=1 Tax=Picocystis salinarum TaxID=88271 RepID=A0A6U9R7N6_9CHLO